MAWRNGVEEKARKRKGNREPKWLEYQFRYARSKTIFVRFSSLSGGFRAVYNGLTRTNVSILRTISYPTLSSLQVSVESLSLLSLTILLYPVVVVHFASRELYFNRAKGILNKSPFSIKIHIHSYALRLFAQLFQPRTVFLGLQILGAVPLHPSHDAAPSVA